MQLDSLTERINTLIEWQNEAREGVEEFASRSTMTEEETETMRGMVQLHKDCTAELPELEAERADLEAILASDVRARVAPAPEPSNRRPAPIPGMAPGPYDEDREFGNPTEVRSAARQAMETDPAIPDECRDEGLRLVERMQGVHDRTGQLARHIVTSGRSEYRSAFEKYVRGDQDVLTDAERRAVQHVRAAGLTDGVGGYAVPFLLDPSVINTATGNGAVANMRSIARVETGISDKWNGVSSAGVSATYAAEFAEATDESPTLTQPSVTAFKGHAFIPYSVEIAGDWAGAGNEFRTMLDDAKADEEEEQFTLGDGTTEPKGIITELTGHATSETTSATNDTFAVADVYSVYQNLAARFRSSGTWMANVSILGLIRQMSTSGGHAFWGDLNEVHPKGSIFLRPVEENPYMASAVADAADVLIFGDFRRGFLIYDRLGTTVELIPMLTGGTNNYPIGARGLYAWWRNGSGMINATAMELLTIQ